MAITGPILYLGKHQLRSPIGSSIGSVFTEQAIPGASRFFSALRGRVFVNEIQTYQIVIEMCHNLAELGNLATRASLNPCI